MLLNHPTLVVALACVANVLVFAFFNSSDSTKLKDKPILTLLKVLGVNVIVLSGLFIVFGESRPEIYNDPVNF